MSGTDRQDDLSFCLSVRYYKTITIIFLLLCLLFHRALPGRSVHRAVSLSEKNLEKRIRLPLFPELVLQKYVKPDPVGGGQGGDMQQDAAASSQHRIPLFCKNIEHRKDTDSIAHADGRCQPGGQLRESSGKSGFFPYAPGGVPIAPGEWDRSALRPGAAGMRTPVEDENEKTKIPPNLLMRIRGCFCFLRQDTESPRLSKGTPFDNYLSNVSYYNNAEYSTAIS